LPLTDEEREIYSWQLDVAGHGEEGQERLKAASVLISRVGGLGGVVAYELAAAGVGRLILAHAGNVRPSDLNRQILMTHAAIGTSRIECARRRLLELNPRLDVLAIARNPDESSADELVREADIVIDCAPLFSERFALHRASLRQGKPLVECAMFELEARITMFVPGETPCLRCLHPEDPPAWKRRFPVFGAVSGTVGCLAAMEAIKWITGNGTTLAGRLLAIDLRDLRVREARLERRLDCPECGPTHP
jgi:molybdopterin/thiamine biosynthesis adenylyltransferase